MAEPNWTFADDPPAPTLLELPYGKRQSIVVVDDQQAAAERLARALAEKEAPNGKPIDWKKVLLSVSLTAVPMVGIPGIALKTAGAAILASEDFQRVDTIRRNGVDVLTVARSETAQLTLPPGHPRDDVVYVGDPAAPEIYYPAAAFHRHTFEHKFTEAVHLLMALGATKMTVHCDYGWDRKMAGSLDVPLKAAGTASASMGSTTSRTNDFLFEANLAPNEPSLPDDLVWFPHEKTWQQVAKGRMKYGLRDFALNVRYEDDFGIDAKFAAGIAKAKFGMGGEFQKHERTSWRIEGEFGSS